MPEAYRAWLEIDLSAIRANLRRLKAWVEPARMVAVVKSDAYGHGMEAVARTALEEGVWGLAVVNVDEGLRLRAAGFSCPVVLVGPAFEWELQAALEADLSLPVYEPAWLERISEAAARRCQSARVHLKVDTGLSRMAVPHTEAESFLRQAAATPHLVVEGLFSHLADAEGLDQRYTLQQFQRFRDVCALARRLGLQPELCHLAASAAAMLIAPARLDAVRVGIAMYGLWPADETRLLLLSRGSDLMGQLNASFDEGQAAAVEELLRPALAYKCRIAQLKWVEADACVGYGCTFQTQRRTHLAILPVGYYEGYSRHLSNQGCVMIRGRRARVLGRVCMNILTVDVTDIPDVSIEDIVTLLGPGVTADEWARRIGTINYEVVTRMPAHLPRVYLDEGQN